MMKGLKLLLLCIFLSSFCFAQTDTSRTLHYKVNSLSTEYQITPLDNYLFTDKNNRIKITTKGQRKNFKVTIDRGTIVAVKGDSIFQAGNLRNKKTTLRITETVGNKEKVVFIKDYFVIPYPIVKHGGVKCDSAITKILMAGGIMYADYPDLQIQNKVKSFKMDIYENGKFTQDSSSTFKLTARMRKYVANLPAGSLIYIKDIVYQTPDGRISEAPVLRLFLTDDTKDVIQVGF